MKTRLVPSAPPRKVQIVDVLDQLTDETVPGYVEFELRGRRYQLDVIGEDDGLFIIFRDDTAGDATYKTWRFLHVEQKPKAIETFEFDMDLAYKPPCAFSECST